NSVTLRNRRVSARSLVRGTVTLTGGSAEILRSPQNDGMGISEPVPHSVTLPGPIYQPSASIRVPRVGASAAKAQSPVSNLQSPFPATPQQSARIANRERKQRRWSNMNEHQLEQHVRLLAWLHILSHALFLIIGIFVFVLLIGLGAVSGDGEAVAIMRSEERR